MKTRKRIVNSILVCYLTLVALVNISNGQSSEDSLITKVDEIFAEWDKPNSPGCVCAVIQDGEIIYKNGFGMANLEYNVALSPESVFYIASTSKQFTAACIALLALSNKISLDSSIRKYIPEMPEFADSISIRHLIHHTSGIRDHFRLLGMAGLSDKDYFNNEMIIKLLSRQKALNFKPGEEHLYSNSNYALMAEIIKRVSGKSLRDFAQENIFTPLGMKNTHFDDNFRMIVKNRVSSYGKNEDGSFFRYLKSFDGVGDGNLLTTVGDLNRWDRNFYDYKLGGSQFVNLLLTSGKLNNGKELDYAFGLVNGEYRGLITVSHGGAFKGFKTQLMRFPEQRFSVAVLCNLSSINPTALAKQVADLYLADKMKPGESENGSESLITRKEVDIAPSIYDEFVGEYKLESGLILTFTKENDRLMGQLTGQPKVKLFPESETKFFLKVVDAQLLFQRDENGKVTRVIFYYYGQEMPATRIESATHLVPDEMTEFVGEYYSEELDTKYSLILKEGKLVAQHSKLDDIPLTYLEFDQFDGGVWFMQQIDFIRDENSKIVGFHVSSGRVKNLRFDKTDR